MAAYTNSPFLTKDPYRPEPQHIGEAAGGTGSMGRFNDAENHRQAPDAKGTYGPDVTNGLTSGAAQSLISKSTGVSVGSNQNPDLYGKPGKY